MPAASNQALILGYSMGGFIGLRLLAAHPERVIRLAIAGVGANYLKDRITSPAARAALADALLVEDKERHHRSARQNVSRLRRSARQGPHRARRLHARDVAASSA